MTEASIPIEIFCCYAHADESWLLKLETHLILLKRQGLISLWHDRLLVPGTDWTKAIDTRLETASVILLLVSADFFVSDYCYSLEMKRALERSTAGEARVIPIILRPLDWELAPFSKLQALPTDGKPVQSTHWDSPDEAFADIARGIREVVQELRAGALLGSRQESTVFWHVPYRRNPLFTGREDVLEQLRERFTASLHGKTIALGQPQAISGWFCQN